MRTLFMRLDKDMEHAVWQLVERGQPVGPVGTGRIDEVSHLANHAHVVALVPSEEVFITHVNLPGKNRNKLLKAVPYAVEDQLVDDIEQLHFALSDRADEGQYTVAVLEEKLLEKWRSALIQAGIRVEILLPDVMALPRQGWSILLESDRALVRTPLNKFAIDLETLPVLLANLYEESGENKPQEIIIYECGRANHSSAMRTLLPELPLEFRSCGGGLFSLLAAEYDVKHSLNLLQGEYSIDRDFKKYFRAWTTAGLLFAIWFVWQITTTSIDYYRFYKRSNLLGTQLAQLHKSAFPNSKKPDGISERADMERRLKELRKQQGAGPGALSEILVQAAPVLKEFQDLNLKSLRYLDGKMEIEINLKNTNMLDNLKQRLSQQTGWQVDVQSASTKGDVTEVRLQLQRKSG